LSNTATGARAWLTLGLISALFFIITAATFDSLGLVLPAMVGEMHWSWTEAGSGFGLLAIFCGITATVPASLIRRIGTRANLLIGSLVMGVAFFCLAHTHGLVAYFVGASLAGLGFTLLDSVPGTYLLARLFPRPSFAIGLYFTIGGLGGAAGPQLYFAIMNITHDWRTFWLVIGGLVVLIGVLAALFVDVKTDVGAAGGGDPAISTEPWNLRGALQTRQFWIIAAAYSTFLFCGITANSVSVAHLGEHGVSAMIAGSMMSLQALLNAGARLAGGLLTRFVNAKLLLAVALSMLVIGLLALAQARDISMLLVYAAGIGIGYGLTFFAATILLLDYFGREPYLELFATVNLISTVGAVAPTLAGLTRDHTGSFTPFFIGLAVLVSLVLLAVVMMRPPHRTAA
jgi:OFA family oxalate/formate antiporter-like MFS transporter